MNDATSTAVIAVTKWQLLTFFVLFICGFGTYLLKVWKIGPFNTHQDIDDDFISPESPVTISSPPVVPEVITESTPTYPKATLSNLCLSIRSYEGWILPGGKDWKGKVYPYGSPSYRNNNPGNVRYYDGGYHPMYGLVKRSESNFAIFRNYETGWLYLNNMLKEMFKKHPNRTLLQHFEVYAPKEDGNDPVAYSKYVARDLGVTNLFRVGDIRT